MNNKIFKNYQHTLKQKFNAVCFEIDGTLTKYESNEIADESLDIISNLVKRGVPVIFITGRGETGLKELKEKIISHFEKNNLMDKNILSNMYALINDGAKLCEFDLTTGQIFGKQSLLIKRNLLSKLESMFHQVEDICDKEEYRKYCKVTFSKDSTTNKKINIRIVLNTRDENIILSIFSELNDFIEQLNIKELNLTKGIYKNNTVLQIGLSIKDNAIKLTEKLIGIPENSMLRIGNCGDEKGNDFSMLNCAQGFSAGKTSGYDDRCFPVFDENKKKLKGLLATKELIKQAKILMTICLEKPDKVNYIKSYATLEKEIIDGSRKYLDAYNCKIQESFNCSIGINDIFDESGSVKIPMYEWILIDDSNPLKQLFNTRNGNSLYYSLRDNQNFLLRGSKTYYHFLANRCNDITSKDNVLEWCKNYIEFTNCCLQAIKDTTDLNELFNKKMILGILDNFRNYLLIMINYHLVLKYNEENILINLESQDTKSNLYQEYNLLKNIIVLMKNICFMKDNEINKTEIKLIILKILKIMINEQIEIENNLQIDNYSKIFRTYRELDNFDENYITTSLSLDKLNNENICPCGISYGGIELPIIYKTLDNTVDDVTIIKFNKKTSGYVDKHSIELRLFHINNYGGLKLINIDKNKKYVLMDDNILSGKTVQLALTALYDVGINTDSVVIVRYPSINRVNQMFMPGHGAVAHSKFFSFVKGLCFPSPYTWRDENRLSKYEDSLGVFDLNREKILKCLYKNQDYLENSEVDKIKRRNFK